MDPLPPGLFQAGQRGRGAKPAPPLAPPPDPRVIGALKPANQVVTPGLTALGTAQQVETPFLLRKLIEFSVGLKVTNSSSTAVVTPGALFILAPQPVGMLPERFFMSKPRVPGTSFYLDPFYTASKAEDRRQERRREAARVSQNLAFRNLLEDLTDDELNLILRRPDLKSRYLAFLAPRYVDEQLIAELQQRQYARNRNTPLSPEVLEQVAANARILQAQYAARDAIERERLRVRAVQAVALTLQLGLGVSASIQPEAIEPVNDAAKRNAASAKGIRRQLVSERADP
jgi:hypothetical protein